MEKYNAPIIDPVKWREYKDTKRSDFMTEEEISSVNEMISTINYNQGSMQELYDRWDKEEEAYRGDQPKKKNRPNTRVNIVNANIDGQVATIIDNNLSVNVTAEDPSDKQYVNWAKIGLEWTFRKNKMRKIIEQHERRRFKFGNAWFKVHFDSSAIYGFGISKVTTPCLSKIFIDRKITEQLDYQNAEYICEILHLSYTQMKAIYGEEKANAVEYGNLDPIDNMIFIEQDSEDDSTRTTILQWWCRHEGILRVLEFSACGVLLYDSHKIGDRTENQKHSNYSHKPYYKFVDNKFPYFFTGLYPEEGKFYGFGNVKLLKPLQDIINSLYDQIRICARPNLILVDPESELDLDEVDENSFMPQPCKSPTRSVSTVAWGTVNESYWRLLSAAHSEAQRVTRFSDLMIGQGASADTATEANIQQQQGNAATNFNKGNLAITLNEVAEYCLGLAMEFYDSEKAFRISGESDEYAWIDFRKMADVPAVKPATSGYIKQYKEQQAAQGNKYARRPKWEVLTNADGTPITRNVDLDIEINVGAGLPKSKSFLWQMVTQLAPVVIEGKQLVSWKEMRKFVIDFLGMPLSTEEELRLQQQMEQAQAQQQQAQQQQVAQATEGGIQGGSPTLSMEQGTPRTEPQTPVVTGK